MWNWQPIPGGALANTVVPPLGPAGAATFAMAIEDGARITYSWQTDIIKSLSGLEQRAAVLTMPRQRYEFSTLLDDPQYRALLSVLAGAAVTAPIFAVGLPYEATSVERSSPSAIFAHRLDLCDWAAPGQRILVRAPDGATGEAVVQDVTSELLVVDADLTAVARYGAEVMPAVPVYLDPEQGFGRYVVNVGRWDLVAHGDLFSFAGGAVGRGAAIETFDGLPVWDAGNASEIASQPLFTGAEIVDLGGAIGTLGAFAAADWGRSIRIESNHRSDWQWLKLFLHTIRGAHRTFLLPTGRPDLVPVGDASSGTLTVEGPPTPDAPDYASDWFPSLAHRRLRIVLENGDYAYRAVTAASDNGGTQDLALDAPVSGAIERVEFLETVRLSGDSVDVTWTAGAFESSLSVRVVQR